MLALLAKLLAVALASLSIAKSYVDYRKKQEPYIMFLFWSAVWIVAVALVVYPQLIDKIVAYSRDKTISIGSLTGLAFIFMLYIVYRIYTKAARIEYQQAKLIRRLGIRAYNRSKRGE